MDERLYDVLHGKEENYLLPFYWQHGDHTLLIPEQIQRIYDSGCRAFCVEARPHPDFVGEGWWRDMDIILSEAKKRNMKVRSAGSTRVLPTAAWRCRQSWVIMRQIESPCICRSRSRSERFWKKCQVLTKSARSLRMWAWTKRFLQTPTVKKNCVMPCDLPKI